MDPSLHRAFTRLPNRTTAWELRLTPSDDAPDGMAWLAIVETDPVVVRCTVAVDPDDDAAIVEAVVVSMLASDAYVKAGRPSAIRCEDPHLAAVFETALAGSDVTVEAVDEFPAMDGLHKRIGDLIAIQGPGITAHRESFRRVLVRLQALDVERLLAGALVRFQSDTVAVDQIVLAVHGSPDGTLGFHFFADESSCEKFMDEEGLVREDIDYDGLEMLELSLYPPDDVSDIALWEAAGLVLADGWIMRLEKWSDGEWPAPDADEQYRLLVLLEAVAGYIEVNAADLEAGILDSDTVIVPTDWHAIELHGWEGYGILGRLVRRDATFAAGIEQPVWGSDRDETAGMVVGVMIVGQDRDAALETKASLEGFDRVELLPSQEHEGALVVVAFAGERALGFLAVIEKDDPALKSMDEVRQLAQANGGRILFRLQGGGTGPAPMRRGDPVALYWVSLGDGR